MNPKRKITGIIYKDGLAHDRATSDMIVDDDLNYNYFRNWRKWGYDSCHPKEIMERWLRGAIL